MDPFQNEYDQAKSFVQLGSLLNFQDPQQDHQGRVVRKCNPKNIGFFQGELNMFSTFRCGFI